MGHVSVHLDLTAGATVAELWQFLAWCGQPSDPIDIVEKDAAGHLVGLKICFVDRDATDTGFQGKT